MQLDVRTGTMLAATLVENNRDIIKTVSRSMLGIRPYGLS
jgi:hypothetical protein